MQLCQFHVSWNLGIPCNCMIQFLLKEYTKQTKRKMKIILSSKTHRLLMIFPFLRGFSRFNICVNNFLLVLIQSNWISLPCSCHFENLFIFAQRLFGYSLFCRTDLPKQRKKAFLDAKKASNVFACLQCIYILPHQTMIFVYLRKLTVLFCQ